MIPAEERILYKHGERKYLFLHFSFLPSFLNFPLSPSFFRVSVSWLIRSQRNDFFALVRNRFSSGHLILSNVKLCLNNSMILLHVVKCSLAFLVTPHERFSIYQSTTNTEWSARVRSGIPVTRSLTQLKTTSLPPMWKTGGRDEARVGEWTGGREGGREGGLIAAADEGEGGARGGREELAS
jgi:hypothetical protein